MTPNQPKPDFPSDPAVEEIRAIRSKISAEHDHDPAKLIAHLIELQNSPEYRSRLLGVPKKPLSENPAA